MSDEENVMPKVNGKAYYCDCGANVFHYYRRDRNKLICNGCEAMYVFTPATTFEPTAGKS